MQIKKEKITPAKAAKWLENNFHRNRKIRVSQVNKYADDMTNNKWKDTGECIKINTKGELIDGQHRLSAIVQSGKTVWLWVASNVPIDSIDAIDTGASRNASDVMSINGGYSHPKHLPTLIRRILAWESGSKDKTMQKRRGVSIQRIMEYADEHPDLSRHILFSFRVYAACVSPIILSQGEWAFLHWLFSQTSEQDADTFLTALALLDAPMKSPIRVLFNRLNSSTTKIPPKIKVNYAIRAWNAWRQKETDVILRIRIADEEPVPDLV